MRSCSGGGRAVALSCAFLLLSLIVLGSSTATADSRTWTTDADFDEGTLINLNHDFPNSDQLQLNTTTTPFPFIWIACSIRGTIVRVDTATGAVLGEYRSAPQGMGLNPSRTTVDLFGNVWTGNRNEASGGRGSIVKIGLLIGGTRGIKNPDGTFTPNPTGRWVAPPYLYNTCVDRDGDGYIYTSTGLSDILDWPNFTDGMGGPDGIVQDAADEAILLFQRTTGPNTRHVSVDANNDVWTAGYPFSPGWFDKIDGNTGAVLTTVPVPCGGYGGLIDGQGVLWSSSFSQSRLFRYDIAANNLTCIPVTSSYGLGIDASGNIWNAMYNSASIMKFDAAGNPAPGFPRTTNGGNPRGVAVTPVDDHVWVANSGSATVARLDNAGNFLKLIGVGATPTGVAVDAAGKVWVTNYSSHNAMRIDPAGGGDGLGAVDLTVSLGGGAGPYNYSDMTGIVAAGSTAPQGFWTVVWDQGTPGTEWGEVVWNGLEPAGTGISVRVRAADSVPGLASESFVSVANGVAFVGVTGQFLEIQTVLARDPGVQESPVLYDLTAITGDCPTFEVVMGDSWDGISLQEVLDAEYGAGAIDVETDYEGYECGDAGTPYWLDTGLDGWIVKEVAGYDDNNILGWYAETFMMPVIDGTDDGVVFAGPMAEGAMTTLTFPAGLTRFGFYMNPNGTADSHNAPEPELFFTNRDYNDAGTDGSGDMRVPDGGDPQCLIYNITHLRNGVPTFVLAWEDLDYASPILPTYTPGATDNDFQDLVIEISAVSPVAAVVADLQADVLSAGIRLRWDLVNATSVDEVRILRRAGDGSEQLLAVRPGALSGEWIDVSAAEGVRYGYRLVATIGGQEVSSSLVQTQIGRGALFATRIERAVPNPFNPSTRIDFRLHQPGQVKLEVYDVTGRRVCTLDLGSQSAGEGSALWTGCDDAGRQVSSGVYVVQLVTPSQRDQIRVALIK